MWRRNASDGRVSGAVIAQERVRRLPGDDDGPTCRDSRDDVDLFHPLVRRSVRPLIPENQLNIHAAEGKASLKSDPGAGRVGAVERCDRSTSLSPVPSSVLSSRRLCGVFGEALNQSALAALTAPRSTLGHEAQRHDSNKPRERGRKTLARMSRLGGRDGRTRCPLLRSHRNVIVASSSVDHLHVSVIEALSFTVMLRTDHALRRDTHPHERRSYEGCQPPGGLRFTSQ